jgi:hypothetical protein
VPLLAAGAWLAVAIIALADRRVLRRLHPSSEYREAPVTLVVPARDEEANIGAWVRAARRQHVRDLRIVVVDDDSSDRTKATALAAADGDRRVEVADAGPLPPGWIGKPWAANVGSRAASAGWLLFSDADMRMSPLAVSSAVEAARELDADALTLTTRLLCETPWERWVMPVIALLIYSAMPAWATHDERLPTALLAGGFMLVRVPVYRFAGGHAAVRASIAEDRDFAEHLKALGFRIRMLDGSAFVCIRMYRGVRQMWEGWRKNFYEGARRKPAIAALGIAGCITMLVLPLPTIAYLALVRLGRRLSITESVVAGASATSLACTVLVRLIRDRSIGVRTTAASIAATPLAGLFAAAVMAASALRGITGRGQLWKGRTIV